MDRKLINPQIVTDIANAIRAKKGTTGTINVSQLATEIATISGGGVADSTKTLIGVISGITPTDETSTNNAIAKGATDTPTEETFTERTTASGGSIKDTIAFVDKVKGNCVKWNQLVNISNRTYTNSGVTMTINNGKVTFTGTCTASNNFILTENIEIKEGHKYLLWDKNQSYPISSISSASLQLYKANIIELTKLEQSTSNYVIGTATSSGNAQLRHRVQNGITYNLASEPLVVDLTEIGMESATINDIISYLGYQSENDVPVMPYQPTTIVLNSRRNLVSSYSRNIWDEQWELGGILDNGEKQTSDTNIRSKNYNPISGSSVYIVSSNRVDIVYYDSSKTFISKVKNPQNRSTSIPTNAAFFMLTFSPAYGTTYLNDTAIFIGSTAQDYVPYFVDNLSVSARNLVDSDNVQIFPNGMLSAGSVCDSWDIANGVAVKKIGVVDLGSLTWNTSTIGRFISQSLRDIAKLPSDNSTKANIILSKYSTTFYNNMNSATGADNVISLTSGGNFYVRDTSLDGKTANEFKSLVNGLLLYYELATPITYNVSKAKAYYKVSQNGKEVASSTDNSAPFKADIAYRGLSAEDVINAING